MAVRHIASTCLPAFALMLAAGCATARTGEVTADLILTNGRIYTVEEKAPWAQAVAIRDGKIIAVGSGKQVAVHKGADTRVIDMGGRFLMPAFGDAHNHPIFGGMSHARCSLHGGATVEDYRRIITACIARTPGDGTIYGVGWEDSLFPPNGVPRREVLDAISTTRPMVFLSKGGHSLWLNSLALAAAGITRATADPVNGQIDRDPATGEPVGGLQEAAMALAEALIPRQTAADRERAIAYTARFFNSLGITAWHDAGIEWNADGSSDVLDAYKATKDRGELSAHVVIDLKWDNGRKLDQIPDILKVSARARAIGLTASGVKFYIDGVIPQQTAAMIAPYEGTSIKGSPQIAPDTLAQAVALLDAQDIQAHFHSIGDGAVREALDAVDYIRQRNGMRDTRPMISHMNVIDPADQPRFGKLGVAAIFQPLWACDEPYMRLTIERIGPVRAGYIYPANSIGKGGGLLAYGADWSVASANPLEGIEVALTRVAPGETLSPLLPREAVTLEQALRAYTLNVAYVNHLDTQTGSIAVGKSADLIVLDQNPFGIPARQIHTIKVLLTFFQGRTVFGNIDGFVQ